MFLFRHYAKSLIAQEDLLNLNGGTAVVVLYLDVVTLTLETAGFICKIVDP